MIKHIIFDCFGTLIDTGTGSISAVKRILESVDLKVDPQDFYRKWKHVKKKMMLENTFQSEKVLFEKSLEQLFKQYNVKADAKKEVKPMIDILFSKRVAFSDTEETMRMLDKKGVDYAIGSSTDTDSIMHFLNQNDLYFKKVYTSEDMQIYKPQSEFYQTILEKTGWKKEECLFVGDNLVDDVIGPHTIGMRTVLIDRKGQYRKNSEVDPDYVINSLVELADLVETKQAV